MIGGTLTPWRSVPRTNSSGRCPRLARCWVSSWPSAGNSFGPNELGCVRGVTLDSRAVRAGDLYVALAGARAHGAAFCDRGGRRRRRGGADRPGRPGPGRGQRGSGLRAGRPAGPAGRDRLLGVRGPVEPAAAHRRDRDQRQDHEQLPDRVRAAGGRSPDRPDRRGRDPDRQGPGGELADHAGSPRPAGAVRGHGRARGDRRRDGGVEPLAQPWPGGRDELRRGGLHQPVAGPPGLPRRP